MFLLPVDGRVHGQLPVHVCTYAIGISGMEALVALASKYESEMTYYVTL